MGAGASVARFCRLADGSQQIAYASMGEGPPLVMLPGWLCHLEESWAHPAAASARTKLAAGRRFVWYERLGCGLSDRDGFEPSLENDVAQLEAVLDDACIERASLIGYSFGAPPAAVFAARHPERVHRLVFTSAFARGLGAGTPAEYAALRGLVEANWATGSRALATILLPNGGSEDLRWFDRFQRQATSASMASRLLRHLEHMDVRDILSDIRVPTLVLHDRHDAAVPLTAGEELATMVAGARLLVFEGNEHDPFIRDAGGLVEAIIAFVEGHDPTAAASPSSSPVAALTPREQEVLRLIAEGEANKQVAAQLGISVATVERHVTNLYRKLGARGRADATLAAVAMGLVDPEPIR